MSLRLCNHCQGMLSSTENLCPNCHNNTTPKMSEKASSLEREIQHYHALDAANRACMAYFLGGFLLMALGLFAQSALLQNWVAIHALIPLSYLGFVGFVFLVREYIVYKNAILGWKRIRSKLIFSLSLLKWVGVLALLFFASSINH